MSTVVVWQILSRIICCMVSSEQSSMAARNNSVMVGVSAEGIAQMPK